MAEALGQVSASRTIRLVNWRFAFLLSILFMLVNTHQFDLASATVYVWIGLALAVVFLIFELRRVISVRGYPSRQTVYLHGHGEIADVRRVSRSGENLIIHTDQGEERSYSCAYCFTWQIDDFVERYNTAVV